MSNVLRRKHVLKEMLEDDYDLPNEKQQIVRVICSRGNNLHEVETGDAEAKRFLASMPVKFRKNVWVKRGDYMLVDPIAEGDKVKAEICKILSAEHIREYTNAGIWPPMFVKKQVANVRPDDEIDSDNDDSMDEAFKVRNHNRPQQHIDSDDDDDDELDSSDDDSQVPDKSQSINSK